jgi:protein-S-isoprenylcysteine O-methyltransferase Ste14
VRRRFAVIGSVVFFLIAPTVVAGVVPWWLTDWKLQPAISLVRVLGVVLVFAGASSVVYSFARFVVEGLGTPAPVAPTEHLVVGGLYRYVRNPMYLAILATILGQALLFGQVVLLLYALIAGTAMFLFARWYEEPELARRFGESYEIYRRNVPGWLPRMRAWQPDPGS